MEKRKYTMEDHLHRKDSPISAMCAFFWASRRGYDDFVRRLGRPEPDRALGQLLNGQQGRVRQTYGYRRMWGESRHPQKPKDWYCGV